MFRLLAVSLLSGATAFAGSFTSDFSNPSQTGYTLNQGTDPGGNSYPVVTNSHLLLLYNEASLGPISFVLDDLDSGLPIDTFTASFQLQIGPGTSTPADGIAFVQGRLEPASRKEHAYDRLVECLEMFFRAEGV